MPIRMTCVKIDDVIAHARRLVDHEGYVDLDQFSSGLKRLIFYEREYKSPLEYIDDEAQNPAWPPTGRWPSPDEDSATSE